MTVPSWDAEAVPEADLRARQAQVLPLLPEQGSILDVGCGEGRTLELLAGPARLLVGVDISPALLRKANDRDSMFENVQADAQRLPFANSAFDTALAQEVLEHLPDWQAALEELLRTTRQRVVVTVPYQEWLKGRHCMYCGSWVPLYGHLHCFIAETFAPWGMRGSMTIKTIGSPLGWRAYGEKAVTWIGRQEPADGTGMTPRCSSCGAHLPQGLRWRRAVDRLWRLLTRKPEWLLVIWETSGESR